MVKDTSNPSVLLLSPFFYPEKISTGKYNTYLAEEFVAQGVGVTVIASHPLYPGWRPEKTDAALPGIVINRGGAWIRYPKSALLRRAILELWYAWHVLTSFVRLKLQPTCVVAVFPPSLFFLMLARIIPRGCRKVGVVHDLQGVYASRSKRVLSQLVNLAIHFVESQCFRSCDRLIFLSSSMANRAILEYGLDKNKCAVCYPFVALSENQDVAGADLAHLLDGKKTNVVYSGALGDKQNPDGLFAFFSRLVSARLDVSCHIFSAGPHFERLRSAHGEKGNAESVVQFHDLVATKYLDELYTRSDIQIIPQADGTADGSLPSKLPNLMAAGVPVFVICETGSELADLVREAGAGGASHTWDASVLVDEFVQLLPVLKAEPRSARKARLRPFVEERFSIRRIVEEIIKI